MVCGLQRIGLEAGLVRWDTAKLDYGKSSTKKANGNVIKRALNRETENIISQEKLPAILGLVKLSIPQTLRWKKHWKKRSV